MYRMIYTIYIRHLYIQRSKEEKKKQLMKNKCNQQLACRL